MQEHNCPMCDGPGVLLGILGLMVWLRCRNCGWDWNEQTKDEEQGR